MFSVDQLMSQAIVREQEEIVVGEADVTFRPHRVLSFPMDDDNTGVSSPAASSVRTMCRAAFREFRHIAVRDVAESTHLWD